MFSLPFLFVLTSCLEHRILREKLITFHFRISKITLSEVLLQHNHLGWTRIQTTHMAWQQASMPQLKEYSHR